MTARRVDMNIEPLKEHFEQWNDFFQCYSYSGYAVVDRVRALVPNPSVVLDVGCGFNRLKHKIPNLIGCDIVNRNADLVMDLRELPFKENSVDCILALGSINFFSKEFVLQQVHFLHSLLKPGGYMLFRGNPGEYGIADKSKVTLFPWSTEAIHEIAHQIGFSVLTIQKDYIDFDRIPEQYLQYKTSDSFRYYWEYQKL